uniref:Uncharacterized protein n=1 Tax=Odontella aurita TaxID=265563 RepID=A0A7S4N0Z0_9STRA|mmetsp:Transcript_43006/g.130930  ORF Transcript_43006/g.130930 Transcript_43006/m.130930 type:complete len:308 (+) Transcript_43006:140-1063(+)
MKIYASTLLVLCASSNVWGCSAFTSKESKSIAFKPLYSMPPPPPSFAPPGTATKAPPGATPQGASAPRKAALGRAKNMWDPKSTVRVEGSSLRTWSFMTPEVEAVQVRMKTNGRPLNANVDLWCGPDNTPQKMGVYIEDGNLRPFNCVMATPWGQNTVAVRNTAQMEFPLDATVETNMGTDLAGAIEELSDTSEPVIVQGGAVKTYSFSPTVASVQILLKTDGRPLNARIELLQGPNNNKQVVEVYTEDGLDRPFFAVIESPGSGNVVRIVNTSPLEFPMNSRVEPFEVNTEGEGGVIIDGGNVRQN